MTCGQTIEFLTRILQTSIEKNLYELSNTIITIQQRLLEKYKLEDKVELSYFTEVLQKSIGGLSHEGKEILLPILRELKLNTIL
jgi:hypothetical protein